MSIFRLLPFLLLIAVGAATLAAQSSPEKNPAVVPPTEPGQLSSSSTAPVDPPNPLDRIRIGEYRPRLNQFSAPHVWPADPDWQSQGDTLCLTMRTYKVARDDPHSDSTHAAGYSTCQPAARFHMHSIEGGVLPGKP